MMITPREIQSESADDQQPLFSVCTLVTRKEQYESMLATFEAYGFSSDNTEFIYIDNSAGNKFSATGGLNRMILEARGKYIILCHQDIELFDDDCSVLLTRLEELDRLDENWALAGNAGGLGWGTTVMRITDPHGANQKLGELPAKVDSLDENFILLKRSALLGFSVDLSGFHLYGADICLHARARGLSAYVINFHLRHLSGGNIDESFLRQADAFEQKYRNLFKSRWLKTTCTAIPLTHSKARSFMMKQALPWRRRLNKLLKHLRLR